MGNKDSIWTKPFISLFFTNMSVFTVFYGLISTLPLYAKDVLNRTDDEAGLLLSIFLLSAIIARPFSGKILDIFGKRRMLFIGLLFYLICTVLYYFIHSFSGLLILRFIQGIWFSIVTTACGSIVADSVPFHRRGAGLGYYTMSTNLAVVVGPLIGLFIIQKYSFDLLFIVLTTLMIIGAFTALMIPKGIPPVQREWKISIHDLFEKKSVPVAVIAGLFSFTYASVLSYISIYAQQKNLLSLASTFFLVFAAAMVFTRPLTGKLFDEKGPPYVLIPAFGCYFIGLILLAFMNAPVSFMIAGVFFGLGYGGIVPSLQTIAIQSAERHRSGYATATFFTLFDIGVSAGSYFLGLIAVYFSYQSMYLFSGGIVCIVFISYLKYHQIQKKRLVAVK